jgi:CO dehydrogenase maturation factor
MALTIAVAGKGGTGKTTLAALLCRALMDRGIKPMLAVDADPNSCLPERLGVKMDRTIGSLREELRKEPEKVPAGIAKSEWIERLINEEITESTGFDMVVMGRQEGPDCYCYINNMLRACLDKIQSQYKGTIIDNEAGLEHLSRRTNGKVDVMLVVSHATMLGARTAMRIVEIMHSLELEVGEALLVLNQCDGEPNSVVLDAFKQTGLEIIGHVPQDAAVADAEVHEQSLLTVAADSPAMSAVNAILDELLKRRNA